MLEIGTGCGYQTAILSKLIRHVYTVERIKSLTEKSTERLENLGLGNISYYYGDGYSLGENMPRILQLSSLRRQNMSRPLLEQLEIGGCLIILVGRGATRIDENHTLAWRLSTKFT
ncbi:MAG: hypothetical protein R3E08_04305 [Thiotrichaceae bacterium]